MTSKAVRAKQKKFDLTMASPALVSAIVSSNLVSLPDTAVEDGAALAAVATACGATKEEAASLASVPRRSP